MQSLEPLSHGKQLCMCPVYVFIILYHYYYACLPRMNIIESQDKIFKRALPSFVCSREQSCCV